MKLTKKVIVFNGSPNKKGHTSTLINRVMEKLDEEISVEVIDIFKVIKEVSPCIDCGTCVKQNRCPLPDDFNVYIEKMNEADFFIIASPMWFGTVSGPLLSFFSRLQIISCGIIWRKDVQHIWDKGGLFLMTSGAKWHSMMKSVETTVEFIFSHLDASILDFIYATDTDRYPSIENTQTMKRCDLAAEKINKWFDDKYSGRYYQYGYNSVNYMNGLIK